MNTGQQSDFMLLGVGGGGCRIVASILTSYGGNLRALGVDTDAIANREVSTGGLTCLLLGGSRLSGHGTGGDAIMGRLALQDDLTNLNNHLTGVRTVVLISCLGSGTGNGVTPDLVKTLHDQGIATLCFILRPFSFEGEARKKAAERVVPMIEEHADSLIVISQDELFAETEAGQVQDALVAANGLLASGITLLWRLVSTPGFISLDTERLHRLLLKGGNARFGSATVQGPDRASQAVEALCGCRLLRLGDALKKANTLLFGILAGADLRLSELGEMMENMRQYCKKECSIEMGTVLDLAYDGKIELVVLAFESWTASAALDSSQGVQLVANQPPIAESFPIQSGSRRRVRVSKLSFGATGRGKFQDVEPTLFEGQDLDIPTYVRRGITLER